MKKATLLSFLFLCVGVCQAMSRYSGKCVNSGQSLTSSGLMGTLQVLGSFPKCPLTVFVSGTDARAFPDNHGPTLNNALPFNQLGSFFSYFTIRTGMEIQLSAAGIISYGIGEVPLFDVPGPVTFHIAKESFPIPQTSSTAIHTSSGDVLGGLFTADPIINDNLTAGNTENRANLDTWTIVDGNLFPRTNAGVQAAVDATPKGGTIFLTKCLYLLA